MVLLKIFLTNDGEKFLWNTINDLVKIHYFFLQENLLMHMVIFRFTIFFEILGPSFEFTKEFLQMSYFNPFYLESHTLHCQKHMEKTLKVLSLLTTMS